MPKQFDAALIAKAKEQVDLQREHYTKRHADEAYWADLAADAKVNLPMFYVRPSDAAVKGLLRKLGVSWVHYIEA
jgi:3-mercaptopyruvate sulfurtransferase SseA